MKTKYIVTEHVITRVAAVFSSGRYKALTYGGKESRKMNIKAKKALKMMEKEDTPEYKGLRFNVTKEPQNATNWQLDPKQT